MALHTVSPSDLRRSIICHILINKVYRYCTLWLTRNSLVYRTSCFAEVGPLLFSVNTSHANQVLTLREALIKSISSGLATACLSCRVLPRGSVIADTRTDGAHRLAFDVSCLRASESKFASHRMLARDANTCVSLLLRLQQRSQQKHTAVFFFAIMLINITNRWSFYGPSE